MPVLGAALSSDGQRLYIFVPLCKHSLADVLRFCPAALGGPDALRLVLYQLLQGLKVLHMHSYAHGSINLQHICITETR